MLVMAASCAKTAVSSGESLRAYDFSASACGLRTCLDGRAVDWEQSDRICAVAYNEEMASYSIISGIEPKNIAGPDADFSFTTPNNIAPRYLIYPSDQYYEVDTEKESLDYAYPSAYHLFKDSFPEEWINFSVGAVEEGSTSVSMRNAACLLKFTIETEGITSITISSNGGEALAGTFPFVLSDLSIAGPAANGSETVSLSPSTGETSFAPGTYFVPVPPVSLASGITMVLAKDEEEKAATKISSGSFKFNSGSVVNLGTETEMALEWKSTAAEAKKINWILNDGSQWPFSTPKWEFRGSRASRVNENQDLSYTTSDGYTGVVHTVAVSASGAYSIPFCGTQYGFVFGGFPGDYLTLPVVEGKALKKVSMVQGQAGASTTVNLGYLDSGVFKACGGCSKATLKTAGATSEWTPTDTESGKQYVLYVLSNTKVSGNYFSATQMTFIYE